MSHKQVTIQPFGKRAAAGLRPPSAGVLLALLKCNELMGRCTGPRLTNKETKGNQSSAQTSSR